MEGDSATSGQAGLHAFDLDGINRRTWQSPATIRAYERLEGWTDPGEKAAVEYVAPEVRSRPILDIGVGAGRTTALLQTISQQYTGIDYTQEMVEVCRARHPGARILHMDARDLSSFADEQFALVVFSFNGIDAVNLDDRRKILREVHRVLQPGGLFIVSARQPIGPRLAAALATGRARSRPMLVGRSAARHPCRLAATLTDGESCSGPVPMVREAAGRSR